MPKFTEDVHDHHDHLAVVSATAKMRSHSISEITVRDFPTLRSDEPVKRGGTDTAPTPLEYVLVGLCA